MAEMEKKFSEKRPAGLLPDRAQPHNLKIEQAVLAALLRDPGYSVNIAVPILGSDGQAFYNPANREIYLAVMSFNGSEDKIDLLTISHRLSEAGKLEAVGGAAYLAEIFGSISTTANIEEWCRILRNLQQLRRMIDACGAALVKCYDSDAEPQQLIEEIETDIYNIRTSQMMHDLVPLGKLLWDEAQKIGDILSKKTEAGIPTGFRSLDECTGGLKPGEMFVLAARPSIGKTSLGLNIIANVTYRSPRPRPVAFFSLEMTDSQIARRLICTESQIPESSFWNGTFKKSDWPRVTTAINTIRKAEIFIDPTGGLTIAELRAKARRLKKEHNIELIVIDYLQLMHADSRLDSRQQEVAEISGGIKKLAKDLQVPILVLAQLNREVDKNASPNSRPKLSHLRESGAIEQDADVVTFLHRNRDEGKTVQEGGSLEAEWIIEKNRNGRIAITKLLFYPSRMEFVAAAPVSGEFAPPEEG